MNLYSKISQHATDFFLYYFLTYLTIYPITVSIFMLITEGQFHIYRYLIGNLIMLFAGGFSTKLSLKYLKPVVIVIGMSVVIVSFNARGVFSHNYSLQLIEMLALLFSLWICSISILNKISLKVMNKVRIKYILKIWLLSSATLFVIIRLLVTYHSSKVKMILSKGSYFMEGGLNSAQIDRLIDLQKLYSLGYVIASVSIFLLCFFKLYTRGKSLDR